MNVYFISGLGADEKAFCRIKLQNVNVFHVKWVEHSADDTLSKYAEKLTKQINSSQPFVLIGLSFGGVIAQEMCKFLKPEKVILISSITHEKEFSFIHKLGKIVVPFLPVLLFRKSNFLINFLFGAKGRSKKVLAEIIASSNPVFLKWAILKLLYWKSPEIKNIPLVKIHGSNDKMFPHFANANHIVKGGSHFMVYINAAELSSILQGEVCR